MLVLLMLFYNKWIAKYHNIRNVSHKINTILRDGHFNYKITFMLELFPKFFVRRDITVKGCFKFYYNNNNSYKGNKNQYSYRLKIFYSDIKNKKFQNNKLVSYFEKISRLPTERMKSLKRVCISEFTNEKFTMMNREHSVFIIKKGVLVIMSPT